MSSMTGMQQEKRLMTLGGIMKRGKGYPIFKHLMGSLQTMCSDLISPIYKEPRPGSSCYLRVKVAILNLDGSLAWEDEDTSYWTAPIDGM